MARNHTVRKHKVLTLDFSKERNQPRRFYAELLIDDEGLLDLLAKKAGSNAGKRAELAHGLVQLVLTPMER
jgi:hypothetical protein